MPTEVNNGWVHNTLKNFLEVIPSDYPYFVLGSLALLSYTQDTYTRQIRDIDIIGDANGVERIGLALKNIGYSQNTFIDKRFPFAHKLQALAQKKYLRFEDDGRALEIMTSDLSVKGQSIDVELYPGVAISIPEGAIQTTEYQGLEFKAVSPETLFCIYNFGLKTWGAIVKTRMEQRRRDLAALGNIIQPDTLARVANNVHLKIFRSTIKIPNKLITT